MEYKVQMLKCESCTCLKTKAPLQHRLSIGFLCLRVLNKGPEGRDTSVCRVINDWPTQSLWDPGRWYETGLGGRWALILWPLYSGAMVHVYASVLVSGVKTSSTGPGIWTVFHPRLVCQTHCHACWKKTLLPAGVLGGNPCRQHQTASQVHAHDHTYAL